MKQSVNNGIIVGTLKSKEVTTGIAKNGRNYISLKLVVESVRDNKVNSQKVDCYADENSKLYKGFCTVAQEYKTIDADGRENADKVKITGTLNLNEYVSTSSGELISFLRFNGIFINRLDKEKEVIDECGVVLECVVAEITDEIGKDGSLTGRLNVGLLSVGYKDFINEFKDVKVESDLAAQFKQLFPVGTTAKLNIALYNYAETSDKEVEEPTTKTGFGASFSNIATVVTSFTNERVIIGGDEPILIGAYTQEEIQEMRKLRELAIEEKVKGGVPAFSSGLTTGFSSSSNTQSYETFNMDDIPF